MTQQILLNVSDDLYQILLEIAQKRGESLEDLALQCLNELQNKQKENTKTDPLEKFIGAFNSNNSDWLENHDYYLGKSIIDSNNNQ